MADTRPSITLPAGVWVDVYTTSGIPVGTAINIWNIGIEACILAIKSTIPTDERGVPLWSGAIGSSIQLTQGETGLWAKSVDGTYLTVQEI